jgi:hypothetical protein
MRRALLLLLLIWIPVSVSFAQDVYAPRLLESLGLDQSQIEEIQKIQSDTASSLRRFQADQAIKKAELARLLLEESPDLRKVEQNLRDTAEIEVQMRMVEIKREIQIRSIVGVEEWTRLLSAARVQRETEAGATAMNQALERLRNLEQSLDDQQRRIAEQLQRNRDVLVDPEIRERFQRLQQEFTELQQALREQLQEQRQ